MGKQKKKKHNKKRNSIMGRSDIPCGKYMDWYNARIDVAKKKAGV